MVRFPPSLTLRFYLSLFLFFFNDTATTEIYTLSLHDALPILIDANIVGQGACISMRMQTAEWRDFAAALDVTLRKFDEVGLDPGRQQSRAIRRSEEHTSELQSRSDLVCRLLLEKKKQSDELHIESAVQGRVVLANRGNVVAALLLHDYPRAVRAARLAQLLHDLLEQHRPEGEH